MCSIKRCITWNVQSNGMIPREYHECDDNVQTKQIQRRTILCYLGNNNNFFHPRNTNTCVRWATKNNNINRYQEYMSMMTQKEMRCNLLKDLKVSLKPSYAFNVMWLHYKLFSNGMVFHCLFFVGSKLNMDYIIGCVLNYL